MNYLLFSDSVLRIFNFEEDIRKYVDDGTSLSSRFALVIVYGENNNTTMKKFFNTKFKELNNSHRHVDIYSCFSPDYHKNDIVINDKVKKEKEQCLLQGNRNDYSIMEYVGNRFNVKSFPNVIVVDKKKYKAYLESCDKKESKETVQDKLEKSFFSSDGLVLNSSYNLARYIDICIKEIDDKPNNSIDTLKKYIFSKRNSIRKTMIKSDEADYKDAKEFVDKLRKKAGLTIEKLSRIIDYNSHSYKIELEGMKKGDMFNRTYIIKVGKALNLNKEDTKEYCEYFNIKKEELLDE